MGGRMQRLAGGAHIMSHSSYHFQSMRIIDITRTIQNAPVYPGSVPFSLTPLTSISDTELFNISLLQADSHIGTHIDAPRHALANGRTIDQTDLSLYFGPCRVVTVPTHTLLNPEHLHPYLSSCTRLLLKTGGDTYLTEKAAQFLTQQNLYLLGTDGLSVAPPDNESTIHRQLLQYNIALLENLQLEQVPDGEYILCAFPLKIADGDGSPVRAVLLCENL